MSQYCLPDMFCFIEKMWLSVMEYSDSEVNVAMCRLFTPNWIKSGTFMYEWKQILQMPKMVMIKLSRKKVKRMEIQRQSRFAVVSRCNDNRFVTYKLIIKFWMNALLVLESVFSAEVLAVA